MLFEVTTKTIGEILHILQQQQPVMYFTPTTTTIEYILYILQQQK